MQKIQQSDELIIYEGIDFSLRLEYNREMAIIHLPRVDTFTPSSFKKMISLRDNWWKFLSLMGYQQVFAAIRRDNLVTKKLASRLGFNYIGTNEGYDIYTFEG